MDEKTAPRAFLSHSWEDKELVRPLAQALMSNGVNVWFDEWEMQLGDSIVQKIDEGLANCDAFLIALSAASVQSKWVREELSAAVVRRIQDSTKLIVIRVDDTPPPTVINHLMWVRLQPTDAAVDQILKSLFDLITKPPLGPAPAFVASGIERRGKAIADLSPEASEVLRHLVKMASAEQYPFESFVSITDLDTRLQLNEVEFDDALDLLQSRGLITPIHEHGASHVKVTPRAWMYLAGELEFDLKRAMRSIAQTVVGHQQADGPMIEHDTGLPTEQIRIAVGALEALDLVSVYLGGIGAGRPYGFVAVTATRRTREWVRLQGQ